MSYLYTIIKTKDIDLFYKILVSFGYTPSFLTEFFWMWHNPCDDVYVIIGNDLAIWSKFCFYGNLKEPEKYDYFFIEDKYKFLRRAASQRDCSEF